MRTVIDRLGDSLGSGSCGSGMAATRPPTSGTVPTASPVFRAPSWRAIRRQGLAPALALSLLPVLSLTSASAGVMTTARQLRSDAAPVSTQFVIVDEQGRTTTAERFAVEGAHLLVWPGQQSAVRGKTGLPEPKRIPLGQCLAVVQDVRAQPTAPSAVVLASGERFPGEVEARDVDRRSANAAAGVAAGGATELAWRHRWLGETTIDLERTRAILLSPEVAVPKAASSDVIVLANGDRVEGVIATLGAIVAIERSGETSTVVTDQEAHVAALTEIPLGRIAAIGLITPDVPSTAPRLWTIDGTVVNAIPELSTDPETLVVRRSDSLNTREPGARATDDAGRAPRDGTATQRIDEIIGFAPAPERIVPLARIQPANLVASGETPRFSVDAPTRAPGLWPMGMAPLTLRGPTVARYDLPASDCLFIAEVRVADPDARWTEFELIVRDGSREVLRLPMTGSSAPTPFAVTIASGQLEIEVTEGVRGPIRDAVEFRRAMVVLPASANALRR